MRCAVVLFLVAVLAMPASILGNEAALRWGRHRAIALAMLTSALIAVVIGVAAASAPAFLLALLLVYAITVPADSGALTSGMSASAEPAVRGATMSMFKDGVAGEDGGRFMADLSPSPAFEAAVKAQGGHGERVEKASELAGALARARDVVVKDKRQALLNVICPP